MGRLRIVVADDHPVVRFGIIRALQEEADIDVVGEATDGLQALTYARELRPDVLVLDAQMPEMDGLAVTREVQAHCPSVRILMLSAYAHDHYVFGTLAEGADGYLLKDDAVEQVVSAVRVVAGGESWLSPQIATKVVQRNTTPPPPDDELGPDQPTEREMDVLERLAQGLSNQEIARSLYISERTVRFHLSNLSEKLQTTSRMETLVEALRRRLVKVPANETTELDQSATE